ncbi:MAG: hypothetical protein M1828_001202 [Chrysothrix sp. TS-e1954]|nr:MAG: hypothetical protein M1828_001202 [Chrysothrix sp. TS-e1954]
MSELQEEKVEAAAEALRQDSQSSRARSSSGGTTPEVAESSSVIPHPQVTDNPSVTIPSDWVPADSLNVLDLELLHNFSTSTCFTLSTNQSIKTVWRINVPKLGFKYHFVMHSLLALSALHLAYFDEEKRDFYISYARSHHGAGLSMANAVLPNLTLENCHAVYTFSALTYFFTLASPRRDTGFLMFVGEGATNWLSLLRGSLSVIREAPEELRSGVLGPLFQAGRQRAVARTTSEANVEFRPLTSVEAFLRTRNLGFRVLHIYLDAAMELRKTFNTVYAQKFEDLEAADVLIWIFHAPQEYLKLLQAGAPEALILLAYFAVLLKPLDTSWWMAGWPKHLLSRVYHLLDDECRLVIRWPMEEMGWVPGSSPTP